MDLVIRNARLIDGTGSAPAPRVSVEVANGAISWIGEESARPARRLHHEDINGDGLTLIPGLMDCHEHFAGDGGPVNTERNRSDTPEGYALMVAGNARRALMSGVTSARDVGSPYGVTIRVARETASGAVLGPRIVASGEWLSFPGTTWVPGVGTRLSRRVETMEDMVMAIQEQIEMGAGLIKVGANGRRPDGEYYGSLGPEVLSAAVRTAHGGGLKIAAHCIGFEASRQAVEAGIDSIEHGIHLEEETVSLMARQGTYLVPGPAGNFPGADLFYLGYSGAHGQPGRGFPGPGHRQSGTEGKLPGELQTGDGSRGEHSHRYRRRGLAGTPRFRCPGDRTDGTGWNEPSSRPGGIDPRCRRPAGHPGPDGNDRGGQAR